MPIYKIDLPGKSGDLYVRYKIKDNGDLKVKDQRILWSAKGSEIEDARVWGTGNIEEWSFVIYIEFGSGDNACYTGVLYPDGTGVGTATSSWQGDFEFKIKKMPKGSLLEDFLH